MDLCELNNQFIWCVCCEHLVGFHHLILQIIFCLYIGGFYVPLHSCYCMSSFGYSDFVTSTIILSVLCSFIMSCVPGLPSSFYTTTIDHVGRNGIFLKVSMFWLAWDWIFKSTIRLLSSLLHNTSCLLNLGSMPLVSLLNKGIARLGNMGLIGSRLICNKAIYVSELVSKHFPWFF